MMRLLSFLVFALSNYVRAKLLRIESTLDMSQWNRGHEADTSHSLQMSIALKMQNVDLGLETLLRISDPSSPDYGQYLSTKDVVRMFEPKSSAVLGVMEWLQESGIDRGRVTPSHSGDQLSLDLSVQEASWLLVTTFYYQIHQETGQEQIASQHHHIPQSLAESIDYIIAASPISTHQQIPRKQVIINDDASALTPLPSNCFTQTALSCLRILYKIPDNVPPHPNNSFGIYQPSWFTWIPEDLDKFFGQMQKELVGHRPKVDAINGGYMQRNETGEGWSREPNLDFEYAMALTSPQEVTDVQVGSYSQVGNPDNMLAAFDKYYCDSSHQVPKYPDFYPPGCNATTCDCGSSSPPNVLSMSYGWTEDGFTSSYLQRQCLEFLKLGLMGTTVVVSISDHGTASRAGSYCINDTTGTGTEPKFSPMFPASCPWVTSVGGTQMSQPLNFQSPKATTNETTFRKDDDGLSSGGGFSNVFLSPPYQGPNVASYKALEKDHLDKIRNRFNSTGRGYPDVAARADDYLFVNNGKWKRVSGTSASNPVFASIITLINSERMHAGKGPVGFINPALYSNSDILNDVVTGANRGCGVDPAFRAATGWDAVTGLGSPDYERMRSFFMSLP
jgi:tripeptidyl-peptidase-1